jgi:hypothetical protein
VDVQTDKNASQARQTLHHDVLHQVLVTVMQTSMFDSYLENLHVQTAPILVRLVKMHLYVRLVKIHLLVMQLVASVNAMIITIRLETAVMNVLKDAKHALKQEQF